MRLALLLLALAGCMKAPDAAAGLGEVAVDTGRLLTVIGTGRLAVQPTRVDLDAVLINEAGAPELVWQEGADRMFKLTHQIGTCGVHAEDMTVCGAHIEKGPSAWRLEQRLRVTLRDMKLVAPVLANALTGGATRVEGARFALDESRAPGDRARERALLDAKDKAQMLAQELQMRLGPVRSVEELPGDEPAAAGAADAAPPPLEAVSQLRVTYVLVD